MKFLPLNNQYSKGTSKNVIRNIAKFRLDISDYMQWYIWANLEDSAWKLAVEYLKINTGDILDIGTNIGSTLLQFAHLTGESGFVYGFEPDDFNFEQCQNNIELNSFTHLKVDKIGLGIETGEFKLYVDTVSNRGGNRIKNGSNSNNNYSVIKVMPLDLWVKDQSIHKIDLIKIDVEGYEMNVLKGGEQTIKTYRPKMFIELDDNNLKDQGSSASDLVNLLETWGYHITHSETKSKVTSRCNFKDCHYDIICEIK